MKKNIVVCILMILAGIVNAQKEPQTLQISLPKWETTGTVLGPPKGAIPSDSLDEYLARQYPGYPGSLYTDESYTPFHLEITYTTVYFGSKPSVVREPSSYPDDGYDPTHGRYENRYYNANPGLLIPLPAPPPLPRAVPYYYIPKK